MGAVTDGIAAAESGAAGLLGGTFTPFVLCAGAGLLALIGVQTWRLHTAETDLAQLEATVATARADRAQVALVDSNHVAAKERTNAADTTKASDDFTQGQPVRAADAAADAARYQRLYNSAEARAAGYRAQAAVGAKACSALADRSSALDRQLVEGVGLVGELRQIIERRDAEVKLQGDLLDADERLVAP
jgi:hypothetical protein